MFQRFKNFRKLRKWYVDERYEIARKLLTENRDMLEYISKNLLERETLDEKDFNELMEKVKREIHFGTSDFQS